MSRVVQARWIVAALVLTALVAGVLLAWNRTHGRSYLQSPPLEVSSRETHPPTQEAPQFVGVILPHEAVDVAARIDGLIGTLTVRSGDWVGRNEVLAVIDPVSSTEIDVTIAEAELKAAESDVERLSLELEQARDRLKRRQQLSDENLVSAEQLADAQYDERLAAQKLTGGQTAVVQKRALLERSKQLVEGAEVRAPFEGTISITYVEHGQSINRGGPIVRLIRTVPLRLRFAVESARAGLLHIGAPVIARVEDFDVVLAGRLERVAPEVDNASQMVIAEADVLSAPEYRDRSAQLLVGRTIAVHLVDSDGRAGREVSQPR